MTAPSTSTCAEEWRTIPGFEGLYQVSSLGRVRRITKVPAYILRSRVCTSGYMRVRMCKDGIPHDGDIHVLMCSAWHGPKPSPLHEAAHWNGDRLDNVPLNLRWATPTEQALDKHRHGTTVRGEASLQAKLTEADVRAIRVRYAPGLASALGLEFGVTKENIYHIVKRRAWRHVA